ncbi:MAG: TonB-dependent receptor [Aquabacterium sp.]|nr:TonB-dependent receptor [Aquabacterium sp.]
MQRSTALSAPVLSPLFAALLVAWAAPAQAQPSPGQLQTVTVTAERRTENVRDVPNSISVLGSDLLEALNAGGQDIRQLSARTPSLNIESSFGRAFPRFYIRGLGNTDFDINASQPVSLVFDDVVQENPILKGFPMFDLDRVEVLRGPQGTLFGRNAPAGVVKFESAKPDSKKFGGYGAFTLGRWSTVNAEGAMNAPLGGGAALRVSLQSQNRSDWVDNTDPAGPTRSFEGYHDNAARVQLLLAPANGLSVLANLHARDLDGSARVFRGNAIKPGTNDLVANFDETKVRHDGINSQQIQTLGGSLRVRWDLGGMALHSITGYEQVKSKSRADVDGTSGPYCAFPCTVIVPGVTVAAQSETADDVPKLHQLTQEFRLESTGSGPVKWLAGLYYFDETLDINGFAYDSGPGNAQTGFITQQQDNKAWAIFGSVNFDLSEQFKLRGGLRYTKDKKDFSAQRFQSPIFGGPLGPLTTSKSATNTSFDVAGTWVMDKNINVYGRLATGFRAPSIQGRILFGNDLTSADSEKVKSVELGVKADLFDRRARASLSVFAYDVKGQQLVAVGGGVNTARLLNAEKTTGRGIEGDFQAYVTDAMLLSASMSYNNTRIKSPGLAVATCGSGCTVTDPLDGSGRALINGNPLPQAPKLILNLNGRYGMPMAGGEAYVMGDLSYRSKVNFQLYESVEFTGKPLTELGLRGGYLWGNGKYEASVFVRNLGNKLVATSAIDFSNLLAMINEPRTFGLQFKAQF